MKTFRYLLTVLAALLIIAGLTSCDNGRIITKFSIPTVRVVYNGNGSDGGEVPSASESREAKPVIIKGPGTMTKHGYVFTGWNTAADGSGVSYQPNAKYAEAKELKLYAQWGEYDYTVTFQRTNGGEKYSDPVEIHVASPAASIKEAGQAIPDPDPEGKMAAYSFRCWNTVADGSGDTFTEDYVVTGDMDIYTQWISLEGNTTYNLEHWFEVPDKESDIPDVQSGDAVKDGEKYYKLYRTDEIPANVGDAVQSKSINIDGYTYNPDCSLNVKTGKVPEDGTLTLKCFYDLKYLTVSFDTNGGKDKPADQTIGYGYTVEEPVYGDAQKPDGTDYKFAGWCADTNYGTAYDFSSKVKSDMTLHAKWTTTITFNKNDESATGTMAAQTKIKGVDVKLNANEFELEDSAFKEWNTAADGTTGDSYENQANITDTITGGKNMTLYAQWTREFCQVTFNINNDKVSETVKSPQTVATGKSATVPPELVKNNFYADNTWRFDGWFTAAEGGTEFNFSTPITQSIELFGHWTPVYKVEFETGRGSLVDTQYVVKNEKAEKPAEDPTYDGYRFNGWYTDDKYGTEFDFGTAITKDTIVYAQWIKIWTVSFNVNPPFDGAEIIPAKYDDQIIDDGDTAVNPGDLALTGYEFQYWSADDSTEFDFDNTTITADTELKAMWKAVEVTITYNGNVAAGDPDQPTVDDSQAAKTATYNAAITPLATATRDGYTFTEWNTKADGTGTTVADGYISDFTEAVTLYAQWTINKVKVTFDKGEGAIGDFDPQEMNYREKAKKPTETPVLAQKVFKYWYDSTLQTPAEFDFENTPILKDTELKAYYEDASAVYFYVGTEFKNGKHVYKAEKSEGVYYIDPFYFKSPAKIQRPAQDPIGTGFPEYLKDYAFIGWYTTEDAAQTLDDTKKWDFSKEWDISKDGTTLYAGYKGGALSVSFVLNGGTIDGKDYKDPLIKNYNDLIDDVISTPVKDGGKFEGWFKDSGFQTAWKFDTDRVTESITLYAKWTMDTFKVVFNGQGLYKTDPATKENVESGTTITEPAKPDNVPSGKTFIGWFTKSTVTDAEIDTYKWDFAGHPVTKADAKDGVVTLYAIAAEGWCEVTFDLNAPSGATVDPASYPSQTIKYKSKVTRPAPDPSCAGYKFDGWFTAKTDGSPFDFSAAVTENTTIYAQWTQIWTVTFNMNPPAGHEVTEITPASYDDQIIDDGKMATDPAASAKPVLEGYEFKYWFKDAPETPFDFAKTAITADTELKAKWDAKSGMTITYNGNDGGDLKDPATVDETDAVKTATYDAAVGKLATASRKGATDQLEGYIFKEWNTAADGTGTTVKEGDTWKFTTAQTLYAQWEIKSYTVTFNAGDGSGKFDPQTVKFRGNATEPTEKPVLDKKVFKFWYDGSTWTEPTQEKPVPTEFNFGSEITKDIELKAWYEDSLALYYYVFTGYDPLKTGDERHVYAEKDGEGKYYVDPFYFYYDTESKVQRPETDPEYPNYAFVGWYKTKAAAMHPDTEAGKAAKWDFTKEWTVDKVNENALYAGYQSGALNVAFKLNGGTISYTNAAGQSLTGQTSRESLVKHHGDKLDAAEVGTDIKKTGGTFEGWYTKDGTGDDWGSKWDFDKDTVPQTSITLYAKWTMTKYDITFDGNGLYKDDKDVPAKQSVEYGKFATEPTVKPDGVPSGMRFVCWCTQKEGVTDKNIEDYKWDFSGHAVTSAQTLYAIALEGWCNLEFDVNASAAGGATINPPSYDPQKVKYNTQFTEPKQVPTCEGYTFVGWCYKDGDELKAFDFSKTYTGDQKVYAKWEKKN